jgi:SAM-dependent methyltransferase
MNPTDYLAERAAFDEVSDGVQAIVDQMGNGGDGLRVLEAGCGSRSHIRLRENAYVVGIDISEEQLRRNDRLNERIQGDVQTFPLEDSSVDIIFCWDVLEHLERPEAALQNFARSLREGGIMVLGSPVANSLKGIITRLTPLWFHVWVFRHLLGNKVAGTKGHGPFPTFFKKAMAPRAIERFACERGMQVEKVSFYQDGMEARLRKRHRAIDLGFRVARWGLKILGRHRIDPNITDFVIVLRRPVQGSPGSSARRATVHA